MGKAFSFFSDASSRPSHNSRLISGLFLLLSIASASRSQVQPAKPYQPPRTYSDTQYCPHDGENLDQRFLKEVQSCSKPKDQRDSYCRESSEPYSLIKDCANSKPEGYLIVPTDPIDSIEVLIADYKKADSQNPSKYGDLWRTALQWLRSYPPSVACTKALAINSEYDVSIHQLHVHLACAENSKLAFLSQLSDITLSSNKDIHAKLIEGYVVAKTRDLDTLNPVEFISKCGTESIAQKDSHLYHHRGLALIEAPGGIFLLTNNPPDSSTHPEVKTSPQFGGDAEYFLDQLARSPELTSTGPSIPPVPNATGSLPTDFPCRTD